MKSLTFLLIPLFIIFYPFIGYSQVTINVKVWVGHDENGNGPSITEVEELFTREFGVIDKFASHDIDIAYCISEENIIEDQNLINDHQQFLNADYRCLYDDPLRFDLYVCDTQSTNGGEGRLGRAVASSLSATLIAHELGHSFGLLHTYKGDSDCLTNIQSGTSVISGCAGMPLYSDGGADGIEDTPVQPEQTNEAFLCNPVRNWTFDSGQNSWINHFHSGASGNFSIDEGPIFGGTNAAYIQIDNGGSSVVSVALYQDGHQIIADKTFTLRFAVKASGARDITIIIGDPGAPLPQSYSEVISIGATPQTIVRDINFASDSPNARIGFWLGNDNNDVWIDNVSLREKDCDPCEIKWYRLQTSCGEYNIPWDYDPNSIIATNIMGQTSAQAICPEQGERKVFTCEQGKVMRDEIDLLYQAITGDVGPCIAPTITPVADITADEVWNGNIILNQEIRINNFATLTISDSYLAGNVDGKLVVEAGATLLINNSKLTSQSCFDSFQGWLGIEVLKDGILNFIDSEINDAVTAIDNKSEFVTTNYTMTGRYPASIINCQTGIRVTDVGNPFQDKRANAAEFHNLNLFQSPVEIDRSVVYFNGVHFERSSIDADGSALYLWGAEDPDRYCELNGSRLIFSNGPRLTLDYTKVNTFSNINDINVVSCDWFTVCNSYFTGGASAEYIRTAFVNKLDFFLNVIDGEDISNAINLFNFNGQAMSGEYGNAIEAVNSDAPNGSYIRDNSFTRGKSDILIESPTADLDIYCNMHKESKFGWNIIGAGTLKHQGGPLNDNPHNDFKEIENKDIYNEGPEIFYYYDENEEHLPVNSINAPLRYLEDTPNQCDDKLLGLIDMWDAYVDCYGSVSADRSPWVICCSCCSPPPPPTDDDDDEGEGEGEGIDGRARMDSNLSVYPNPVKANLVVSGYNKDHQFKIFNNAGIEQSEIIILEQSENSLSLSVKHLPAGMYYMHITDQNHKALKNLSFVKI